MPELAAGSSFDHTNVRKLSAATLVTVAPVAQSTCAGMFSLVVSCFTGVMAVPADCADERRIAHVVRTPVTAAVWLFSTHTRLTRSTRPEPTPLKMPAMDLLLPKVTPLKTAVYVCAMFDAPDQGFA